MTVYYLINNFLTKAPDRLNSQTFPIIGYYQKKEKPNMNISGFLLSEWSYP